MHPSRAARWCGALVALLTAWASCTALGWRHLWVDEVDTAERAAAVLAWGYPRIIDAHGQPSFNTGGLELEDGETHRFSPWGQFYISAVGLAVGRALGAADDASVRAPAALMHAAGAGLATWACIALGGAPVAVGTLVGLSVGVDSVRLTYARQARYHPMVEALLMLALVGLALLRDGRARGWALLALPLCVMPHVHTLGGGIYALTLGCVLLAFRAAPAVFAHAGHALRAVGLRLVLPALLSGVVLLLITRPWRQDAWAFAQGMHSHALDHGPTWWSLAWAVVGLFWLLRAQGWRVALPLMVVVATPVVLVQPLDALSVASYRYFLQLPLLFGLWPLLVAPVLGARALRVAWLGTLCVLWAPDLVRTQAMGTHAGLTLVLSDARAQGAHARQPLHQVVDELRQRAAPDDAILWDLVPQYANWYLPGHPIALLPDAAARNASTAASPLWNRPLIMPTWHIWFPAAGAGPWNCSGHCDYTVRDADVNAPDRPYTLSSGRLGQAVRMCPVMGVPANRVANAPFLLLSTGEFSPGSAPTEMMVVARRCDAENQAPAP